MHRILFAALLLGLALPATAKWEPDYFVIAHTFGWTATPADPVWSRANGATRDYIEGVVRAGYNTIMCGPGDLDLCHQYGLHAWVFGATPEDAARLRDDPAIWTWFGQDEPGNEEGFKALVPLVQAFHEADPNHPVYINLLCWGGDYARGFLDIVQPALLSYDYYQWWYGGPGGTFSRLEEHRNLALQHGLLPLYVWLETNTNPAAMQSADVAPPADNAVKVRQSVYTALPYGIKGIQWFTSISMFQPTQPGWGLVHPEYLSSELNSVGRDVATVNAELKYLGPTLVKLRSREVFHTLPLAADTRPIPGDFWVQTRTPDLVLGALQDPDGVDYLMVSNRSITQRRWVVLSFRRPVAEVLRCDKRTGEWTPLPTAGSEGQAAVEFILQPGDGELLRVR